MTSLYQDIKYKLSRLHLLEKIIVVNTFLFVIFGIVSLLIPNGRFYIFDLLSLSNNLWDSLLYPWTFLTYGFLHQNIYHLFFNMLYLYILTRTFSNLFNPKMSLKIYVLGIFSGGLLFVLISNLIPVLRINNSLVGASAGVWACIIFLCTYMPNKMISIFRFNFKLKYLAYFMIIYNLFTVFSINSGGGIAHYGGCILGFCYANKLNKGRDIGKFLDSFLNYFTKPIKTVHKTNYNSRNIYNHQKQIDLILDKISKSGYDSLSQEEKDFLFRAGKK